MAVSPQDNVCATVSLNFQGDFCKDPLWRVKGLPVFLHMATKDVNWSLASEDALDPEKASGITFHHHSVPGMARSQKACLHTNLKQKLGSAHLLEVRIQRWITGLLGGSWGLSISKWVYNGDTWGYSMVYRGS